MRVQLILSHIRPIATPSQNYNHAQGCLLHSHVTRYRTSPLYLLDHIHTQLIGVQRAKAQPSGENHAASQEFQIINFF